MIKNSLNIYIQSNPQQNTAAKVSKFSFERFGFANVRILNLDENNLLKRNFYNKFKRNGKIVSYDPTDLQSFTLLRFYPPAIQKDGYAMIIDPDIFALKNFENEMEDIAKNGGELFCTKKNGRIKSEVMLINCKNFNLWNFNNIIDDLFNFKIDYSDLINLNFVDNNKISLINENFNSHDSINKDTILLHTTNRITQPWKVGLDIDYSYHASKYNLFKNYLKKILYLPHNEKLLMKKYQKHKNQSVIDCVKNLFKDAIDNNYLNQDDLNFAIEKKFISKNFIQSF